ncbi:MAG TPA: hypothetical protein VHU19_03855 [Pyrinomonadaceae bacterium]|jgi:hypothetical protein|nr:hypothetical protein [Pyrinomonadaceae bacterium]
MTDAERGTERQVYPAFDVHRCSVAAFDAHRCGFAAFDVAASWRSIVAAFDVRRCGVPLDGFGYFPRPLLVRAGFAARAIFKGSVEGREPERELPPEVGREFVRTLSAIKLNRAGA